jgi:Penicillin binding protein transpeptidase domain/NTF2-like N-terminal transpeptidase domain/Penicillin-binding Protein dimerisation domain
MFYRAAEMTRRRQRLHRMRAIAALAAVAFVTGILVGAAHTSSPSSHKLATRFVSAWARGNYAGMYADIDATSRREVSQSDFVRDYEAAAMTATLRSATAMGSPRAARGLEGLTAAPGQTAAVTVPLRVRTQLFGTLALDYTLPMTGHGEGTRVAWSPSLLFPGMRRGEELTRRTQLPPRAALLARDGSPLASGSASAAGQRESPLGAAADGVVGELGAIPSSRAAALESEGVPADALVGVSGLERALDDRLRGTPGGDLLAGERVLASVAPRAATPVRTTISPALQRAAASALGGQYGGVVALEPRTGAILAVSGIGMDDLQPPGSTFKMVTVTAALEAGLTHTSTVYPYATYATLDGVKLSNANGEDCGGTLALAFAVSCNSVFAPLGVKVGAPRLVAMAERFGFNHEAGVAGALESTLPPASRIQGELDVGSTAIGQGEVQASALQMAVVAATIADGGRRPLPTFIPAAPNVHRAAIRVTTPAVARTVRRLMIGVVREGTGTSAAIPGVTVAGKTGTAELGMPSSCKSAEAGKSTSEEGASSESSEGESGECAPNDPHNTDAWFAAFAPALHPRIVVGVLLPRDGAGGDTAAPVARQVLEAGLQAKSG